MESETTKQILEFSENRLEEKQQIVKIEDESPKTLTKTELRELEKIRKREEKELERFRKLQARRIMFENLKSKDCPKCNKTLLISSFKKIITKAGGLTYFTYCNDCKK